MTNPDNKTIIRNMTNTHNETTNSPSQILKEELQKHRIKSKSTLELFDEKIEAMKKQRREVEKNFKEEENQLIKNYNETMETTEDCKKCTRKQVTCYCD